MMEIIEPYLHLRLPFTMIKICISLCIPLTDHLSMNYLTPTQLGVLLTFQPVNAGYIMDKVVLSNLRKAFLHCISKINNTTGDSLMRKKFVNVFTVLPFLFFQASSFEKNQLRERSEIFKNLIMEDKIDDILVGDIKKKTSTAHSI